MALPAGTNYDLATVSNPSSALTDFTLIVDLSNMSSSWWSAVDTSDGTKGRAAIHSSGTELACDWIDFDDTAETGLLRVKWTGTLSSSGTQQLRIYPPEAANASYSASDTYGSDNAYDSYTEAYWPLSSDGNDRTSNSRDLTAFGSITFGGVSGLIGDCTDFDGTDDYARDDTSSYDFSADFSFSCLANFDTNTTDQALLGTADASPPMLWRDEFASGDRLGFFQGSASYDTNTLSTSTWYHCGMGASSSTPIYLDGATNTSGGDISGLASKLLTLGTWGSARYLDGKMQHAMLCSIQRSTAWFAEESSQLKDNATFWGTWTWQASGTTINIDLQNSESNLLSYSLLINKETALQESQSNLLSYNFDIQKELSLQESQSNLLLYSLLNAQETDLQNSISEILSRSILTDQEISLQNAISEILTYNILISQQLDLLNSVCELLEFTQHYGNITIIGLQDSQANDLDLSFLITSEISLLNSVVELLEFTQHYGNVTIIDLQDSQVNDLNVSFLSVFALELLNSICEELAFQTALTYLFVGHFDVSKYLSLDHIVLEKYLDVGGIDSLNKYIDAGHKLL